MKINNKNAKKFDELHSGTTFIDMDGDVCIKINDYEGYNVYCFNTNELYRIEDYIEVPIVDIEINIL